MPLPAIRPLLPADLPQLVEVYRDAVLSQAQRLYAPAQVAAWAGHAGRGADLDAAIRRGQGLVCVHVDAPEMIEAFALLDPIDRLSLLYCRGRSSRQGLASLLVVALERQAAAAGVVELRTEASQLSRPLLERLGWWVEAEEEVLFAGERFRRWRMRRRLG